MQYAHYKVRNDISVATLSKIYVAICEIKDELPPKILINSRNDCHIYLSGSLRPEHYEWALPEITKRVEGGLPLNCLKIIVEEEE